MLYEWSDKMKERLLELILDTEHIESLFHSVGGDTPGLAVPSSEMIGDIQEFQLWIQEIKLELQAIYTKTQDAFIKEALGDLSVRFDGWTDKRKFDKVKGDLLAIQRNIDIYYPQESAVTSEEVVMSKKPKIFISHATSDKVYVQEIVSLLDNMGLTEEHIFCSSIPGYDIPVGKTIFQYLLEQFHEYDLHVIFVHSKNYYMSPVCLNEMGAAWALKSKYTSILLPTFGFSEMKGVVNSSDIAIKLDNEVDEVKDKLNELYEQLIEEFELKKKRAIIWEKKRDAFIEKTKTIQSDVVSNNPEESQVLSYEAYTMLNAISGEEHTEIIRFVTMSGTTIQYGNGSIGDASGRREFAKWDAAIEELISLGMIKKTGKKDDIYTITNVGYKHLEAKS